MIVTDHTSIVGKDYLCAKQKTHSLSSYLSDWINESDSSVLSAAPSQSRPSQRHSRNSSAKKNTKICHHLTLFPPVFLLSCQSCQQFFSSCLMLDDHITWSLVSASSSPYFEPEIQYSFRKHVTVPFKIVKTQKDGKFRKKNPLIRNKVLTLTLGGFWLVWKRVNMRIICIF